MPSWAVVKVNSLVAQLLSMEKHPWPIPWIRVEGLKLPPSLWYTLTSFTPQAPAKILPRSRLLNIFVYTQSRQSKHRRLCLYLMQNSMKLLLSGQIYCNPKSEFDFSSHNNLSKSPHYCNRWNLQRHEVQKRLLLIYPDGYPKDVSLNPILLRQLYYHQWIL